MPSGENEMIQPVFVAVDPSSESANGLDEEVDEEDRRSRRERREVLSVEPERDPLRAEDQGEDREPDREAQADELERRHLREGDLHRHEGRAPDDDAGEEEESRAEGLLLGHVVLATCAGTGGGTRKKRPIAASKLETTGNMKASG